MQELLIIADNGPSINSNSIIDIPCFKSSNDEDGIQINQNFEEILQFCSHFHL